MWGTGGHAVDSLSDEVQVGKSEEKECHVEGEEQEEECESRLERKEHQDAGEDEPSLKIC